MRKAEDVLILRLEFYFFKTTILHVEEDYFAKILIYSESDISACVPFML